jgi:hypothetical protein
MATGAAAQVEHVLCSARPQCLSETNHGVVRLAQTVLLLLEQLIPGGHGVF